MTIVRVRFTPNGVPTAGRIMFQLRHDTDQRPLAAGRDILNGRAEWEPVSEEGAEIEVMPSEPGFHYVVRAQPDGHPQANDTYLVPTNGPVDFAELVRYDPKAGMAYEPDPEWWAWAKTFSEGKDAYQVAVDNGYEGTLEEWLADLQGPAGPGASDPEVATYVSTEGTATRAQLTGTFVSKVRAPVDIKDFGANGDGVTNDSAAINAAIQEMAQQGGGELLIPKGSRFFIPNGIDLDTPGVSLLSQGGWLGGGTVRVGQESGRPDFSETRVSILHDSADPFGASKAIILKQARGVRIGGLVKDAGVAISADAADGAEGFHALGEVVIDGFRAARVDYAIHAHPTEWDVLSDWSISNLSVNFARKKAISMTGVDGLRLANSVFFGLNYSQVGTDLYNAKEELVHIGKTNQVTATGNKFFESGLSALRMDEVSNMAITGNVFTWNGQRQQRDAIEINGGSPRGAITGNMFDGWTRAAIGIYGGNPARLEMSPNGYQNDLTAEFNKTGVALTSSNTYRHFVGTGVNNYAPPARGWSAGLTVFDSVKGSNRVTSRDRKGERSGVSGTKRRSVSVTGPDTNICTLQDFNENPGFGGLIHVHARSTEGGEALTADYLLFVSDDMNRSSQIATIQALGYTGGANASQPSFTWGISGQNLRATPINCTSGSFFFEFTMLGAVAGY